MKNLIFKKSLLACLLLLSMTRAHTQVPCTNQTLWSWGDNNIGPLGDGTNIPRTKPGQIGSNADWKQLFMGTNHFFVVKNDSSLWGWGNNYYGALGNGTTNDQLTPVRIGTDRKSVV